MDIFSLVARLTLDKSNYDQGLDEAAGSANSFGDRLKKGLGVAANVGGAALAAAATGVAAITKQSVAQYAEYEQLVGGVETLFKDSAGKVQEYASNAYRTAGLSANEYMTTVTSFSASLLQSLGGNTAAAADLADQAITDMSDNANKMGTDMAAIQTAYNGFAKQNYTMLDNLKLGYGGTKQEMERLLADATKLSGIEYDVSSYADIVQAIHVVQTELGITGTTAKEASSTISGSIASMKSAWTNLITGLGDENADFTRLIGNVVDSAVTVADNLIPRIQQILRGFGNLIERMGPVIADKLPGLVREILPSLLSAAISLVQSLITAVPSLLDMVLDAVLANLPTVVEMGLQLILALAQGISENLPALIPTVVDVVLQIVDILTEPSTLANLVDAALQIMIALANGLIKAIPKLIQAVPKIISNLVSAIIKLAPKILSAGVQLIGALVNGMAQSVSSVVRFIGSLGTQMFNGIGNIIRSAWTWGRDVIVNFYNGIVAFISKPIDAIKSLASRIKAFLGFSEPEEGPLSNFHTYAPDMMALFAKGIRDNKRMITDAIGDTFSIRPTVTQNVVGQGAGQEIIVPRDNGGGQRMLTAIFEFNGSEIGRLLTPLVEAEQQRIGVRLSGVSV